MAVTQCRPLPLLTAKLITQFQRHVARLGPYDCWPWTGALDRKGYGRLTLAQQTCSAPRVAWAIGHGDPTPLHVLHRCDNPICVNPNHLFIGTHQDNVADMHAKGRGRGGSLKGTENRNAKIAEADVVTIRLSRLKAEELSKSFGVSVMTISAIRIGKIWKHVDPPKAVSPQYRQRGSTHSKAKLTEKDVIEILGSSQQLKPLADRFGVSKQVIYAIRHRKIWKHVNSH